MQSPEPKWVKKKKSNKKTKPKHKNSFKLVRFPGHGYPVAWCGYSWSSLVVLIPLQFHSIPVSAPLIHSHWFTVLGVHSSQKWFQFVGGFLSGPSSPPPSHTCDWSKAVVGLLDFLRLSSSRFWDGTEGEGCAVASSDTDVSRAQCQVLTTVAFQYGGGVRRQALPCSAGTQAFFSNLKIQNIHLKTTLSTIINQITT